VGEKTRAYLGGGEPPPIARLIGFEVVDVGPGTAVFTMVGDPTRHANPMGTMHGGVLVDLGDAAMGFTVVRAMRAGDPRARALAIAGSSRPIVWSRAGERVAPGGAATRREADPQAGCSRRPARARGPHFRVRLRAMPRSHP